MTPASAFRPAKLDRLATSYMPSWQTGALEVYDPAEGGDWSRPPVFPNGAGGLVSTADDYLAFAQMLMDNGRHGKTRILSRPSVELMTTDQLTPEQKIDLRLRSGALRRPWLGLLPLHRNAPHAASVARKLRLGRRHGHLVGERPARGDDHDPDDPERSGVGDAERDLCRLPHAGVRGDRRLTERLATPASGIRRERVEDLPGPSSAAF